VDSKSGIAAVPNKVMHYLSGCSGNAGHVVIGDKIAAEAVVRSDGAEMQSGLL
jgi:hypothetical protein